MCTVCVCVCVCRNVNLMRELFMPSPPPPRHDQQYNTQLPPHILFTSFSGTSLCCLCPLLLLLENNIQLNCNMHFYSFDNIFDIKNKILFTGMGSSSAQRSRSRSPTQQKPVPLHIILLCYITLLMVVSRTTALVFNFYFFSRSVCVFFCACCWSGRATIKIYACADITYLCLPVHKIFVSVLFCVAAGFLSKIGALCMVMMEY